MTHWMSAAASRAGLDGADRLDLPAGSDAADAWNAACTACAVGPRELASALAKAFRMEIGDLERAEPTAAKLVPGSVARKFGVFPLSFEDRNILVATANPFDTTAEQEVGFSSGRTARFAIAPPLDIMQAIESTYSAEHTAASMISQLGTHGAEVQIDIDEEEEPEEISEAEIAAEPVVRLTNIILAEAVASRASDIHIQPMANGGVVRFRSDGVLRNAMQMPLPVITRVVSRVKIMAQLDITDRLRPQDGRTRVVINGSKYDLRVSTVPTRNAEKAVIRILDPDRGGTLEGTRMPPGDLAKLRRALSNRDGVVVVTGPTGSGKTTTLYGALREIATDDVNIMTVEDPVEYELAGLTQIQVEEKQGMTFGSALRAILRQDPDVIFVGEIRDSETAQIAAQASLTGHLVLSTLHTNDAIGSIHRLLDLGLNTPTVAETLRGALAQRLMREVCRHCSEDVGDGILSAREQELVEKFGERPVMRARGCERCRDTGYAGRLPVTEFLEPTPELVRLMMAEAPPFELHRQAVRDGMVTLLDSALERVRDGATTLEEVERVIGDHGSWEEEFAAELAAEKQVPVPAPAAPPAIDESPPREEIPAGSWTDTTDDRPGSSATDGDPFGATLPSFTDVYASAEEGLQAAATVQPTPRATEPERPEPVQGGATPAEPRESVRSADTLADDESGHPRSNGRSVGAGASPEAHPVDEAPAPADRSVPVASTEAAPSADAPVPDDAGPGPAPNAVTDPFASPVETGAGAEPSAPEDEVGTGAEAETPDTALPHILVVDDDGATRSVVRAVLQNTGYRTTEACDGSEALVRFSKGESYDLMLLDLDMPSVNGRDVLKSVRASMSTIGLPVVVLTASKDRGAEVELMELGADDYLRKPIEPKLLATRVKAALRRAGG